MAQQTPGASGASTTPNAPNQLLALPGFGDAGTGGPGQFAGPPPPWWRRRRNIIIIAVVLLLIILGGTAIALINQPKPLRFQMAQVQNGDLSIKVSATGPLQSGIFNIVFKGTGGLIDELDVKVGDHVKAGQILAKLDKTALQDAFDQAKVALDNAKQQLASAQQTL